MSTRRPGKFEAVPEEYLELAKKLYSDEIGPDEEIGDVDDFGWYGLHLDGPASKYAGQILHESPDGFVDIEVFVHRDMLDRRWRSLDHAYALFLENDTTSK